MPTPAALPTRRSVLLTGATGFVGQAVLERLLREGADVHLVIRGKQGGTAHDRLEELLGKSVFSPWREEVGEDGVAAARERIHVIEADLGSPLPPLPEHLDLVIHSASNVSFDEPWDSAVRANVVGPRNLYDALLASPSRPHVIHVSTCYVGTDRLDVSPEAAVLHDADWADEIEAALALRSTLEASGCDDVDTRLRDAGRARAHALGWTDVYTMTKTLGEQVALDRWASAGHRLTVLRPTIIESALARPYPGWIDGFKVADPLIAAFAKGRLEAFPGHPDAVLDIVPVDVVVDAALAAAVVPHDAPGPRWFQVGTGTSNPITLEEFSRHVEASIQASPWTDRDGTVIRPRPWAFLSPADVHARTARRTRALDAAHRALSLAPRSTAGLRGRIRRASTALQLLDKYTTIYQAYTCSRTLYDDARTRDLLAAARDRGVEGTLDVTRIDWAHYLREVHMPSLAALVTAHRRTATRTPDPAPAPTLPRHDAAPRRPRRGRPTTREIVPA